MSINEKEIDALITLLGDDDPGIKDIARQRLLEIGEQARPRLRATGASDGEGRIRIEAQSMLEEMRLAELAGDFGLLDAHYDFDLEAACFILAEIEYPNLNVTEYTERLDHLAHLARRRIDGVTRMSHKIRIVNHLLFYEKKFRGNIEDYYEPENSYINKVLDRRLGIPITLSALYLFIARRLDLPIYGVGFPGHFMLKFQSGDKSYFVDAFNRGRVLSVRDVELFLTLNGYEFEESHTHAVQPREILARMIRNLVLIYHQNEERHKIETLEKIFSNFVTA